MSAFKAYDIRGIYNRDFSREDVYRIGYFLPQLLNASKILVGRDVRTSSPEIFEYLAMGITDAGADVYNAALATTPMIYYGTARYQFPASVMITASHNPREYNGLKISRAEAMPVGYDTGLAELEKLTSNGQITLSAVKGKIHDFHAQLKEDYLRFLKNYLPDISSLSVIIDCSNGMAGLLVKDLLGNKPLYLFDEPDGTFPNHEANPLVPENVEPLIRSVTENRADVGVIFDGDADRVMFVDENGKFISPDLIIAVLGHYFLKKEKGNVLQDIRSSKAVGEYLAKLGGTIHTWRVGRAFASPKLKEINGIYGGEFAGHYYFRDFYYSDSGLLACLIALNVFGEMKKNGITVSQLIDGISKYAGSGEINFRIEQKTEAMNTLRDYFIAEEKPVVFCDFDGYRIEFKNWWFNVRPSNTEPYLRFIAEADTRELLEQKLKKVNEILSAFI